MKKMMNVVLVIESNTMVYPSELREEINSILDDGGDMELFLLEGKLSIVGMCKLEVIKEKFPDIRERYKALELKLKFHSFEVNAFSEDVDITGKYVIDLTRLNGEPISDGSKSLRTLVCEQCDGEEVYIETAHSGRDFMGKCSKELFRPMFNRVNKIFFDNKLRLINGNEPKQEMNVDAVIDNMHEDNAESIRLAARTIFDDNEECLLLLRDRHGREKAIGKSSLKAIKDMFVTLKGEYNVGNIGLIIRACDRSVYENCHDEYKKFCIVLPKAYSEKYVDKDVAGYVESGRIIEERIAKHLKSNFVDNLSGDSELYLDHGYGRIEILGRCSSEKIRLFFDRINKQYYSNKLELSEK